MTIGQIIRYSRATQAVLPLINPIATLAKAKDTKPAAMTKPEEIISFFDQFGLVNRA